ncbi:MAG: TetR/AcrR family transcriptional regulator [Bacteroidetes bacterium]|nr:TetR/AcrR family transcriptional regulator [Bacteroidota bacterium]
MPASLHTNAKHAYHHGNVRESCIAYALDILEQEGPAQLSLRKVAKGIGVSHNAPYRWFRTREDLLVSITIRIFDEIQELLRSVLEDASGNPANDFLNVARAYFHFAREHPQKYRLIAGSDIVNSSHYPELMQKAMETLQIVNGFLEDHTETGFFQTDDCMRMSIHFVSTIHGYCSLVIENRFDLLGPDAFDLEKQFDFTVGQLIRNII